MRIVSRLISDDAAPRLARVGADAIVSVSRIGSLRLASEMLRPRVVSVLDAMLREPSAIRVCEVTVGAGLAGQTLAAAALQDRIGVTVFAMRLAASREHRFNPLPSQPLAEGDVLIACADPEQSAACRLSAGG